MSRSPIVVDKVSPNPVWKMNILTTPSNVIWKYEKYGITHFFNHGLYRDLVISDWTYTMPLACPSECHIITTTYMKGNCCSSCLFYIIYYFLIFLRNGSSYCKHISNILIIWFKITIWLEPSVQIGPLRKCFNEVPILLLYITTSVMNPFESFRNYRMKELAEKGIWWYIFFSMPNTSSS